MRHEVCERLGARVFYSVIILGEYCLPLRFYHRRLPFTTRPRLCFFSFYTLKQLCAIYLFEERHRKDGRKNVKKRRDQR
jgi:hypothetical protein